MKNAIFFPFSQTIVTSLFAFSLFGYINVMLVVFIFLCICFYIYWVKIPSFFSIRILVFFIPYYLVCFVYVLISSLKVLYMLFKGPLVTNSVQAKKNTGFFFKSFFLMHGITSTPGTIFMSDSINNDYITFNKLSYESTDDTCKDDNEEVIENVSSLVNFVFGKKGEQ